MIVAVDTGGTKTLVAVFNTDGHVVGKNKFPTPINIDEYLIQLKQTIDDLLGDEPVTFIAVALPGVILNDRMMYGGNLPWHDTDMRQLLSDHYSCSVIVENDANLAGLAEARSLEQTPKICLYVTVSTGIGTGIITDGQINRLFSTSEGGQMALMHNGALERWEKFGSGKAIHEKYGKLASEIEEPAVWNEIGDNVAQGLLAICPILRPDIIIIGGGVGAHLDKFSDRVGSILDEHLSDPQRPTIIKAAHPEEAVIYGCYYHALDTLTT